MKKLRIPDQKDLTFEEVCDKYILNCRQRNLREGTINHYKQSYTQFYKYFDKNMPITELTQSKYDEFVVYLCNNLENDVSINAYLRDLITTLHFAMNDGYLPRYKMKAIKVDKTSVETYTDEELKKLLAKPKSNCSFTEYQAWVISSFLFSTGVRQRSLINIQVKDLDFDNNVVYVNVTKNRKPLIVPLNRSIANILKDYLKIRQHKTENDYLFCSVFGNQLSKSTSYHMLYDYNKRRGVQTTGIHRYRHTFAKKWILSGGDVVSLSKLLGHSKLDITQNYINLLVSDVAKKVNEIDLLSIFGSRKYIKKY